MKAKDGATPFWTKTEIMGMVEDANRTWQQASIRFVDINGGELTEADIVDNIAQPTGVVMDIITQAQEENDTANDDDYLKLDKAEDLNLLKGVKSAQTNDIDVVFVGHTNPITLGRAYFTFGLIDSNFPEENRPFVVNSIIMEDKSKGVYNTLAHEIGHILLQTKHFDLVSGLPDLNEDGEYIRAWEIHDPYGIDALARLGPYNFPSRVNLMRGAEPVIGSNIPQEPNSLLARKKLIYEQVEGARTKTNLPFTP